MTRPVVTSDSEEHNPRRRVLGQAWLWPYGALVATLALTVAPAWWTVDRLVVGSDVAAAHYPWFVLARDMLAAGEVPLWNPYKFGGHPAFATLQAGYGYPLHWLLIAMPAIPAINWLIGLHVVLAGLGAAWCAGRLGAAADGQMLSGLAYALGSALTARLWAGHLSFIEASAWLPVATGLAVDISKRHAVGVLASVVGLLALAGQPELLIFSLWWLPAWAAATTSRGGSGMHPGAILRRLIRVVIAVGIGIGLASFQLLPTLGVLGVSNRTASISWEFRTAQSLAPWHLVEVFAPFALGGPERYWPGPLFEWHERLLYIGVIPLLTATGVRGRLGLVCLAAAAMTTVLAFGRYLPGYDLLQVLPGYGQFRIPGRHLVLTALALALAAGLGLERARGRRFALAVIGCGIMVLILGLGLRAWVPDFTALNGRLQKAASDVTTSDVITSYIHATLLLSCLSFCC